MTTTSKAKIFLAEERAMNQTSSFRSQQTFNFGKFFNAHKTPVGNIYVLNDDTLDGGRSISMLVQEDSFIILLPVVGAIQYNDSLGKELLIAAGQVQVIHHNKGTTLSITNPFKEHLVNFLQVWIKAGPVPVPDGYISTYDVNEAIDTLVTLTRKNIQLQALPFTACIGKFNGRAETVYTPMNNQAAVFVFVLEGAFEVEGRLLHARDGLALWQTGPVEMEALSNDALLLLIEHW